MDMQNVLGGKYYMGDIKTGESSSIIGKGFEPTTT